jgi:hypothetical protein
MRTARTKKGMQERRNKHKGDKRITPPFKNRVKRKKNPLQIVCRQPRASLTRRENKKHPLVTSPVFSITGKRQA